MPDRRQFLASVGAGLSTVAGGWSAPARQADSTWLTYAPNVELYWRSLPFPERLKKLSEAGFAHYEFGGWKAKDFDAIARRNEELGLQATLFNGYAGMRGSKWKEGLLDAAPDAAELAPRLGAAKVSLFAADRDEQVDRQDHVDDLVDALKELVEKAADFETVLILEVGRPAANRPQALISSADEAAAVVKAVGSDKVRFAFPIDPAGVLGGKLPESLAQHKAQAGYYRLNDFGAQGLVEERYARVLKAIHDLGHPDPIGLGLAPKVDPVVAIDLIRKLDASAKAL